MYTLIEKYSDTLSKYNINIIILVVTMIIVITSLLIVYLLASIFNVQDTSFLYVLAIVVPSIQAPLTISIVLKLSKHLKHFKEELEIEISKNKAKDVMLFEQAKFVLMGEMMANISHQWKQPLNTIGLSIVAARTTHSYDEDTNRYFDIIEDNVGYLATTIDDFMSFFDKKHHSELRSIKSIIKEINSIIYTHVSNRGVKLEIFLDESNGSIEIASSISQVVLNLINNAKDAFDEEQSRDKKIIVIFRSSEYGLEVECWDNGKGISDEIKDKIFNPYFTTKEKSQGTGIGLHMSKEIVQKFFNGDINLSKRRNSRSTLYSIDNTNKTCFFIAVPYSSKCVLKKEFE